MHNYVSNYDDNKKTVHVYDRKTEVVDTLDFRNNIP